MVMHTRRRYWAKLGGLATLLCWGGAVPAWAAPTPAQILGFAPRQTGVDCTNPTAEQRKSCKVELVKAGKGSGWLLKDGTGQPVRRFLDADGDNKIDTWSYFKNGSEVYREVDANHNAKPDQYRWLNAGGMKWGLDPNEDGRIDSWKAISPEEVSQEVLLAIKTRNFARLQALLLTEAEIKALGLPEDEAKRYRQSVEQAKAKFEEAVAKLKDLDKAAWLNLEVGTPHCRPGETGPDLISHPRSSILYEIEGKTDWVQTGELVQVGPAWRLTGGPSAGAAVDKATPAGGISLSNNPELRALFNDLAAHDKNPPPAAAPGPNEALAEYNLKRADILEKIVAAVEPKEREPWIKQMADSLGTAAQHSPADNTTAADRLKRLEQRITKEKPGSSLAGFVVYRRMQADYSANLHKPGADFPKLQQAWLEKLAKFVSAYSQADDTDEALLQLGMISEFVGKESEAKKWYAQLARDFADSPPGVKAKGALRRLDLDGKPLGLSGSLLGGGAFDMSKVRGKVVVVYWWASWTQQSVGDFAKFKLLLDSYKEKGLELVTVNLDSGAEEAADFVKRTSAPGTHLHEAGGLEGRLPSEYGIMVVPTLFLVDKDGKVVSRTVQLNTLEEEIKKLLK